MNQPKPQKPLPGEGLTRNDIIKKYLLDYNLQNKIKDDELAHLTNFCDSIGTLPVLAEVLDPRSHIRTAAGKRLQPRVADLYDIRDKIVERLWHHKRADEVKLQAAENAVVDKEISACKYCVSGDVFDLVWLDKANRWSVELIGTCAKCAGGRELPSEEIIDLAKATRSNCRAILWHLMIFLLTYRLASDRQAGQTQLNRAMKAVAAQFRRDRKKKKRREKPVDQEIPNAEGEIPF